MKKKPLIIGIKGLNLSQAEFLLLRQINPWGIILFERNIKNISQLKHLIIQIKKCFNDKNFPILIDQEGGRVSRLNKIFDFSYYTQKFFGNMYRKKKMFVFKNYYENYINFLCHIFNYLGININTSPVLDIERGKSNGIIGDRSFSTDKLIISQLGKLCIQFHNKNKIGTIIKHIPGHGASNIDSHHFLPKTNLSRENLTKNDFFPFMNSKSFFAMTAHVKYNNFDSQNPATHSRVIINEIIRKKMKFRGVIMTDDISMKALKEPLKTNVIKAISAGCNLILHCNANYTEMRIVGENVPLVDNFIIKKTSQFYNFLS